MDNFQIICCSEEGEIFGLESTLESAEADKTNQNHLSDYTAWIEKDHLRPSLSLDGSIFYKELYLTVSDWQFHIWKSCGTKLFVSPQSSVLLTGGKWSRRFPGVLYISTCDGSIDVWNFADVSCADFPVTKLLTSPKSITAMEIIDDESTSDEALAIGNSDGSLQVYHLPLNFLKKPKKIHSVPESLAIGGGCIDMKVDLPYSEATRKNASNSNDGNEEKKGDDEIKQNVPKLENFLNSFEEFEKSCAKELGIDIVEE